MAHYANDQLSLAIEELQKAHELEPNDTKIRANLIRALKFQAALLTENKEYERAIENWLVVADLTPDEKEKVSYKIEELEDKIFERAKKTNTLEDYTAFLKNYPDSPYADMARKKIEELKNSSLVEAPVLAKSPSHAVKPASTPPVKQAEKVEKGRKVKIKVKSLRVRATPSDKATAVARVKGEAIVQILSEKGDWYKIAYAKGKMGWIAKKFTVPMKEASKLKVKEAGKPKAKVSKLKAKKVSKPKATEESKSKAMEESKPKATEESKPKKE
jgi:tetratricopeptide (TPR) repeat protein